MRIAAAGLALLVATACGRSAPPAANATPAAQGAATAEAAPGGDGTDALAKATVTLYFPSAAGDVLAGEPREIVETSGPAERGGQILAALLDGPKGEGLLKAAPDGTTLRRLWVQGGGIAYADFSDELARGMNGGSADELLTIYAIVDSLTLNIPEIQRVGVLVNGRERDTLGGHVDIRRPLAADRSLITK